MRCRCGPRGSWPAEEWHSSRPSEVAGLRVIAVTVTNGRIAAIDLIADPENSSYRVAPIEADLLDIVDR